MSHEDPLVFEDFPCADPERVRPFVYADEHSIALHFEISSIQSRMRRDDPYEPISTTRA